MDKTERPNLYTTAEKKDSNSKGFLKYMERKSFVLSNKKKKLESIDENELDELFASLDNDLIPSKGKKRNRKKKKKKYNDF